MRVHKITELVHCESDRILRFLIVCVTHREQRFERLELFVAHAVLSLLFKRVHTLSGKLIVSAADLEKKSFEIGRNKDIHRRRYRLVELSVDIVSARSEEIGQHVVDI